MRKRATSKIVVGICLVLLLALALPLMSACEEEMEYNIGLTQFATHPAADAGRQGFIDALADAGYVEDENVAYDYQNPEGDPTVEQTIAQKFVDVPTVLVLDDIGDAVEVAV